MFFCYHLESVGSNLPLMAQMVRWGSDDDAKLKVHGGGFFHAAAMDVSFEEFLLPLKGPLNQ